MDCASSKLSSWFSNYCKYAPPNEEINLEIVHTGILKMRHVAKVSRILRMEKKGHPKIPALQWASISSQTGPGGQRTL